MKKLQKLFNYPKIIEFLGEQQVRKVVTLDSVWRSGNAIFALEMAYNGTKPKYVFKALENPEHSSEIEQIKLLARDYEHFTPKVHCIEDIAMIMDYVPGENMFSAFGREGHKSILRLAESVGEKLARVYCSYRGDFGEGEGRHQLDFTIDHYGKKCLKNGNLSEEELGVLKQFLDGWKLLLKGYRAQTTHNDLNIANVLFTEDAIWGIDPEYDSNGTNDIARDIGRYTASLFFNYYDYFCADGEKALEVADSFYRGFSKHWKEDLEQRMMFYIAQSALSFSNFKTNGNIEAGKFKEVSLKLFKQPGCRLGNLGDAFSK